MKQKTTRFALTLLLSVLTTIGAWAETIDGVTYIDENGAAQTRNGVTVLTGAETALNAGWYVVNSNINYTGTIALGGNVNIILADGKTMSVGTENERISDGCCIRGYNYALAIYGQSAQTGTLNAYNSNINDAVYVKSYDQHGGNVTIDNSEGKAIYLYNGDLTLTRGSLTANTNDRTIYLANSHTINISGGTLTATGYTTISGTNNATVLTMTGGTVNATGKNAINGNVTMTGGNLTATGSSYGIKGTINLGWTSASDRITASSYNGTVTVADGQVFTDGSGNNFYGTIADLSTIADKTLQPTVPYIAANGNTAYCTNFTVLQGGGATTLQPGWYVVNSDISYTGTVTIGKGEATIILCNGKTMNVGTSESRINTKGINDGSGNHSSALTIYGQSLDDATAGHLNIYTTGIGDDGINLYSSYTQHSGNVTISTTGSPAYGIYAAGGLTLNGGTLSVTAGNTTAIRCNHTTITGGKLDATTGDANNYGISDYSGNITLGYTNASDYIHVSGYYGTVNIAYGQVFTDGNGNNFYGTITDASTIAGKMLTPSNTFSVAANQNPAAVGEYWATFHNPVAGYTVPSGTTAYIGTVNGSSLTLTEVEGGFIPAGNAVILKGTSASFDLSRADTGDAFDFTANELKGGSTVADGKVVYTLAARNGVVGFYKFAGTLNPNKAHLEITPPPAQSAPAFFGFGGGGENTTAINEPELHQSHEFSGDYYTLDGRKLQGKPTQKGIYVRNGRKIIIK